jgi:hypothetical protein
LYQFKKQNDLLETQNSGILGLLKNKNKNKNTPARSADPVSSPLKKYPCIGVTFEIGGTKPTEIGGTKPTFVPPISNVTPIHGYFFTGEETGSADRAGGLTFKFTKTLSGFHGLEKDQFWFCIFIHSRMKFSVPRSEISFIPSTKDQRKIIASRVSKKIIFEVTPRKVSSTCTLDFLDMQVKY